MIPIPIIAIIIVVLYILSSIKILREYERGVIFRLGRLLPNPKAGNHPGVCAGRPHGADFAAPGSTRGTTAVLIGAVAKL